MNINLKGRNFLTLKDFSSEEIVYLLEFSAKLKKEKKEGVRKKRLDGKNVALIFEKPSTRTRCAFVAACVDEGAHPEYLGRDDIQLGKKETVKDTARVLGRMFDGIQFRGFKHETVEELGRYAGVPVWNGLTDKFHPTQALADFLTVMENKGSIKGIKFAYVGDGRNNVANSLMVASSKIGVDFRIATAKSLFPDTALLSVCNGFAASSGAKIFVTENAKDAVKNADVIYTDVWASMGEEEKIADRIKLLKPYQVNRELVDASGNSNVIFLHCLPAFHNALTDMSKKFTEICEVTDEIFEGQWSKVFDQAENRLHTIKAVMVATLV